MFGNEMVTLAKCLQTLLFHDKNGFRNESLENLYRKYLHRLNHGNLRTYILLQLTTSIGFIVATLLINMVTVLFDSDVIGFEYNHHRL